MKHIEKTRVLIIDDEHDAREFLKNTLERKGFTVIIAEDGDDGLEKLQVLNIPIVICDIVMPKVDGIEFLKRVHACNVVVEVIMLTGQSNLSRCLSSIEHGACSYLIKPVDIQDLLEHIQRAQRNIKEKTEMIKVAFTARGKK